MLVAIEGIDYSGKSTQLELLKVAFPEAIFTREPGGTELAEKLRDIFVQGHTKDASDLVRGTMILAGRIDHYEKVISKVKRDELIITDRSMISGHAYNNLSGHILEIHKDLNKMYPIDLVVIITLTADEFIRRKNQRDENDEEDNYPVEHFMDIQEKLIQAGEHLGIENVILVDGTKDKLDILDDIMYEITNLEKENG